MNTRFSSWRRVPHTNWPEAAPLVLLIVLVGAMLSWLSIARYAGYNVGMLDLGNMAQAIASVKRGEPLMVSSEIGNTSRLALHVELIYLLIAIPYALWPDPRLLLLIQAGLFVLGAIPVYRMTLRRTQSLLVSCCLVLLYLFYPVAQTSVLWDFHGDTLAMPLLLFAIDALDRRAWGAYALFAVLAVSCKFYVALPVALLGVVAWWCYGQRRVALLTIALSVAYGAFAFLVIRPFFTAEQTPAAHQGLNYLSFYFGQLEEVRGEWRERLWNTWVVFGPAFLLIWRGWPWLLPAFAVAVPALLSTAWGPAYDYRYHHYAVAVPFIMMAAVEGASRFYKGGNARRPRGQSQPQRLGVLLIPATVVIVVLLSRHYVNTPLNPKFWGTSGTGQDEHVYGQTLRDRVKDRFLREHAPPEVPLAASPFLAPHLTDRATLYLTWDMYGRGGHTLQTILKQVDAVVADALFDFQRRGNIVNEASAISQVLRHPDFRVVASRDGLIVFQRHPPPERHLLQQVEILDTGALQREQAVSNGETVRQDGAAEPSLAPQATFGSQIGLVDATITPLHGRRFRATFTWLAGDIPQGAYYVAVSRLAGVEGARIVHIPTYGFRPTTTWKPGQVVRETFDVEIPADIAPGRYQWHVAWYDARNPLAYTTDERSRLPGSEEVSVAEVELQP